MDKELLKHKTTVMKSIMGNPKLARMFRDALKSPLGSTKRDNARTTLSIIGKIGKANDGRGGPGGAITPSYSPSYSNESSPTYQPDFSNMMIFPAAPKFKLTGNAPTGMSNKGQGGPGDGRGGPLDLNPFGSMDFNSAPISGSNWKPTDDSTPATVTPTPTVNKPNVYHPGILSSIPQGTTGFSLPAESAIVTSLAGAGQWLGQNVAAAGERLGTGVVNALLGTYTDANGNPVKSPIQPVPFTSFGNTWGGNATADLINKNWPTLASSISSTPTTPTTPTTPVNPVTTTQTQQNNGGSTQSQTSSNNTGGSSSSFSPQTLNIASKLSVDPSTPFSTVVSKLGAQTVWAAVTSNEGGSPAGVVNNPSNIKFNNLPGQIDSGVKASDGGTYASYATLQAGQQAGIDLVNAIAGGNTSYGASSSFGDVINRWTGTSTAETTGTTDTTGSTTDTTGTQNTSTPDFSTAAGRSAAAAAAVKSNMGPGNFALAGSNAIYGGSLQDTINKVNEDIKKQFGIGDLEDQLNTLKNEKGDIIPTLQSYIQSKDQYLKVIDQMIANTQDSMSKMDMSNPVTAAKMNDYMGYLSTLQNRQNQRYGNYLNSMITDYNNDVQSAQNAYTTAYNNYTTFMTSEDSAVQADYQNVFNSLSDAYNQLDQAPTKLDNATLLHAQAVAANLQVIQNAKIAANGQPTFKSSSDYLPMITDSRTDPTYGKTTKVLKGSSVVDLPSLYGQVIQSGLSDSELTANVTDLMKEGMQDGGLTSAEDYIKTIANLAADQTYGSVYAPQLAPVVEKATADLLNTYVTKNTAVIKTAIQELVNSTGGLLGMGKNQPAALNSTSLSNWVSKYTGKIDAPILSAISMAVQAYMTQSPAFQQNPGTIFTAPFGDQSGDISKLTTDDLTKIITSLVNQTWSAQMDPANYQTQTQQ